MRAAHAGERTQQGNDRTGEDRGRHQARVVARAQRHAGNVGHYQPNEADGAAKGRHHRCQHARDEQQQVARHRHVDAQVSGISGAQQQGIQGLDHEGSTHEGNDDDAGIDGHLIHAHTREVAEAPRDIVVHALLGSHRVEQLHHAGGEVTDQDADDEQHGVAAHDGREADEHDQHHAGTQQRTHQDCQIAADALAEQAAQRAAQRQDDDGHTQSRSRRHTQDRWACQRVVESGLQQQTRNRERSARQCRRDDHGDAGLQDDDVPSLVAAALTANDVNNTAHGNIHRAKHETSQSQHH